MNLDQILITSISRLNSHKLVDLSRIKHTVIIPILRGLDWDDTNPDVFWPKYRSSNCLFDYALLFSGTPLVLIKCCQIKNMESGEIKYLFDHANDERVISLILTNGNRWDIFLCDNKGSSEDNLIFSIDLTKEENINNYTKNLNLLLGYNSVISGKSRTFAENLVSEKQERKKAKEMVSKAWDSILVEPDEILVELLIESVENLCGFKPDVDYVKTFLRDKREDTIPSYRADPETDRINIFTEEISKLSHTRLTSARFGDFRPARLNWKSIQILALTSVLDVCKDLEELRRISRANIVEGIKTDMGYTYIQSHRFSCQLKSAPRTAETVIHCAKFLRYELYLDFEWSSNPKSSYPGKKGLLTYSDNDGKPDPIKPPPNIKYWTSKGVSLPEGTQLSMKYNGIQYTGVVEKNYWVVNGNIYKSPSAAANDLARTKEGTRTQLNGWKYWKVKRPDDKNWQFLDSLRNSKEGNLIPDNIDTDIEIDEIMFD